MKLQRSNDTFRWLHLSDLHTGLNSQGWLWPTFKHALYDDLNRLIKRDGAVDFVVFSGDLTQKGDPTEFGKLTEILAELWEKFSDMGFSPLLIPIPGNHDLVRPDHKKPAIRLLSQWSQNKDVQEDFFRDDLNDYRSEITSAFCNYTEWMNELSGSDIPMPELASGLLPGDVSAMITKNGAKIGIVGLNSAWLQLQEGDYESRLHVDVRQLLSVTDQDPVAWTRRNNANLLVTHHPPSWMAKASLTAWESEINPPGRFTAHLFGHMHEPDTKSIRRAGSTSRNEVQAASLFGLEKINGMPVRTHGYGIGEIPISGSGSIKLWPRKLRSLNDGSLVLGADYSFSLADDDSVFLVQLGPQKPPAALAAGVNASLVVVPTTEKADAALVRLKYHVPYVKAHSQVRSVEQRSCQSSLTDTRVAWLVSEWGMGAEGFIASVKKALGHDDCPTFRIDLQDFKSREQFLGLLQDILNNSFQGICEAIADLGTAYVFLDEVPAGQGTEKGFQPVEQEVESLIRIMLDYCPEVRVVVRSRLVPLGTTTIPIELKPLDEADILAYVAESDFGGVNLAKPEAVANLYRITDGVPSRLDVALRELAVVGIDDLLEVNLDFTQAAAAPIVTPAALVRAVQEISSATDPILKRSFDLLKALSTFPRGEQLQRIKRFNGPYPFFTPHALELIRRSLVKSLESQDVVSDAEATSGKTLAVPRPVREYVRSLLTTAEVLSLDRKALSLYFGDKWASGDIRSPGGHRFDDPRRATFEIINASTIIVRFAREAVASENERQLDSALRLASSFAVALAGGNHFRSGATFCQDILAAIPDGLHEDQAAVLKEQFASHLRMSGDSSEARDILSGLDIEKLPASLRLTALHTLLLCHDDLDEVAEITLVAERIKKLDRHSSAALQADAIILEKDPNDSDRLSKLADLETVCRRKGAHVTANNIAIVRAEARDTDQNSREKILEDVINDSKTSKDFYNQVRAVVQLANMALSTGPLSAKLRNSLISAYNYLFHERGELFDECHKALWDMFSRELDTEGLLKLFRNSSFIWRLRRSEDIERKYHASLTATLGSNSNRDFRRVGRELSYYIVRSAVISKSEAP